MLNTTNIDQIINIDNLKTENYEAVETNPEQREKTVLTTLSTNFPSQFHSQLMKLCKNYSDVFGLGTELITTNNFYKHKLRLIDDEPIYIKNYRNPHSQKDEIQRQVQKLINVKIVEPSVLAYNSPLIMVPKKSLPNSENKQVRKPSRDCSNRR